MKCKTILKGSLLALRDTFPGSRAFSSPTHRPVAGSACRLCRTLTASSSVPSWNPQNTEQPQMLPSPEFSPEEAVRIQLDALKACDEPWMNHGIQTMYEFGIDIGGLDPSFYFGFRKDLYHLDHFMGQFQTQLSDLVNLRSYCVVGIREEDGGGTGDHTWIVEVSVLSGPDNQEQKFEFHLRKKNVGARKGALMTAMILRSPRDEDR